LHRAHQECISSKAACQFAHAGEESWRQASIRQSQQSRQSGATLVRVAGLVAVDLHRAHQECIISKTAVLTALYSWQTEGKDCLFSFALISLPANYVTCLTRSLSGRPALPPTRLESSLICLPACLEVSGHCVKAKQSVQPKSRVHAPSLCSPAACCAQGECATRWSDAGRGWLRVITVVRLRGCC
jgi:hypothetical protein